MISTRQTGLDVGTIEKEISQGRKCINVTALTHIILVLVILFSGKDGF